MVRSRFRIRVKKGLGLEWYLGRIMVRFSLSIQWKGAGGNITSPLPYAHISHLLNKNVCNGYSSTLISNGNVFQCNFYLSTSNATTSTL